MVIIAVICSIVDVFVAVRFGGPIVGLVLAVIGFFIARIRSKAEYVTSKILS